MKVLVTGVTGSFGRHFVAHLLRHRLAERIVGYSRNDHQQALLREELGNPPHLHLLVGDVRDEERLYEAFYRVDTVVHAAALKRVEDTDPMELYKTNVEGTQNVVRTAIQRGTPRVLFLSSDKACQPVTSYGLSKAMAEQVVVYANTFGHPNVKLSVIRYGNVIASQGSVIPLWRRQAAAGEPLTLTDERCTRFWLTLDQAVEAVLEALSRMRGGEVFIPHAPTMRITDLAEAIAGPNPAFKASGLRAGEKLHEVLVSEDESLRAVEVSGPRLWYALEPPYNTWAWRPLGDHVPPSFRYRSDEATERLTVEQMRRLLP